LYYAQRLGELRATTVLNCGAVLAARPLDLRFGAMGTNTLRGLQHELDLHSLERKH
jgi:hypothetical protein